MRIKIYVLLFRTLSTINNCLSDPWSKVKVLNCGVVLELLTLNCKSTYIFAVIVLAHKAKFCSTLIDLRRQTHCLPGFSRSIAVTQRMY